MERFVRTVKAHLRNRGYSIVMLGFHFLYVAVYTWGMTILSGQICGNLGEHMVGNVYVLYDDEEAAAKALASLHGRFYAGGALLPEVRCHPSLSNARVIVVPSIDEF